MEGNKARESLEQTVERNEEIYRTFQREFHDKIEHGTPEEGVTRMQILEQMMQKMNSDITMSNLKFVSSMIDSMNEEEIIESKKENS